MSAQRSVMCKSTSPHVQELFRILNESNLKVSGLASYIPLWPSTVYDWAHHDKFPNIVNLEAAFNALGYTLVVQPLQEL